MESRPERGKALACLKPATMDAVNAAIGESNLSCSVNRGNAGITMAKKMNTAKRTVNMRPAVRQRAPLRWKMTYRHAITSPRCIVANGNVPRTSLVPAHNCRNQAITRFENWGCAGQMSVTAIYQ